MSTHFASELSYVLLGFTQIKLLLPLPLSRGLHTLSTRAFELNTHDLFIAHVAPVPFFTTVLEYVLAVKSPWGVHAVQSRAFVHFEPVFALSHVWGQM